MIVTAVKQCNGCQQVKSLSAFGSHATGKDGRRNTCAMCIRQRMQIYSRARYATTIGRASQMVNSAKCRANRDGLSFNICVDQVHILVLLGRCQKSDIPFDLSAPVKGFTNPFAPSLDRIDANLGYEPDNIQVVCNMFNMGKSDHCEIDFIALCVAVADKHRDDPTVIAHLEKVRNAGL